MLIHIFPAVGNYSALLKLLSCKMKKPKVGYSGFLLPTIVKVSDRYRSDKYNSDAISIRSLTGNNPPLDYHHAIISYPVDQ